jgi:nitrogen fixation protein NifU and related proteins
VEYSDKIMDHFRNPRNLGEISDADGIGTVGNPNCGDVMKMYIRVGKRPLSSKSKVHLSRPTRAEAESPKEEEYIQEVKFQTLGCGAAIASSSIATELVLGKSLGEALKITGRHIANEMGKFPPAKYHCSILAEEGIKKAIEDYQAKKKNNSFVSS